MILGEDEMITMLQVKGLEKEFDGTKVLNGIDLEVKDGEFVAIMGQSGSGKSTLLYNISGMDRATAGRINLRGEEISTMDDEKISKIRLSKMGFIFQQAHLLKTLSIHDNIALPGLKAKYQSREAVNEYAKALMKRTGIESIAEHDTNQVSGGQLQRAAICRALINHPDIIFGDEPTGALNSAATKEIMDIMNEINRDGTTIVMVTHDAKVAARADRAIFLSDGLITNELYLGTYLEKNKGHREAKMNEWLSMQGF